jgi:hypothetical protein
MAGLKFIENLRHLKDFITNWQSAGTALVLYGLATYLPVAKEVLLGANMLSNFVAQLRGFSCSQVMEAIKEFNYQDSYLIKRCIARKLNLPVDDVDLKKIDENKDKDLMDRWYKAYKECLNSASLVDLFGGDTDEANKYLRFISPRSLARCYLGVNRVPTAEEIANADLQTRAKYFLYMLLPDISMDSRGLLRVRTVDIVDTRTGQRRPATLVDVVNMHVEDFEKNFDKLIEDLKGVIKYDMDYEEALNAAKEPLQEFERKYGITAEDMAGLLILALQMRDYMEKEITANGNVGEKRLQVELIPVDELLSDIREHFRYRVIERIKLAISENALRLREAEEMRMGVGFRRCARE